MGRGKRYAGVLAAGAAFVLLAAGCAGRRTEEPKKLYMQYYYYPACESCEEGEAFAAYVDTMLADVLSPEEYEIELKNMAADGVAEEFENLADEYGTEEYIPSPPAMKVGDVCLFGLEEIETEIHRAAAKEYSGRLNEKQIRARLENVDEKTSCFVYFYKEDCPYCVEADAYMSWLASQREDIRFIYIDIGKTENMKLANEFYKKYSVPEEEWKAPMIFWKDGYFFGVEAIREGLMDVVDSGSAKGWRGMT